MFVFAKITISPQLQLSQDNQSRVVEIQFLTFFGCPLNRFLAGACTAHLSIPKYPEDCDQ